MFYNLEPQVINSFLAKIYSLRLIFSDVLAYLAEKLKQLRVVYKVSQLLMSFQLFSSSRLEQLDIDRVPKWRSKILLQALDFFCNLQNRKIYTIGIANLKVDPRNPLPEHVATV